MDETVEQKPEEEKIFTSPAELAEYIEQHDLIRERGADGYPIDATLYHIDELVMIVKALRALSTSMSPT